MCLTCVKQGSQPLIAEEDIRCFKVLRTYKNGELYSPYMIHGPLVLGDLYTFPLDRPDEWGHVERGLHAFLTLEQAQTEMFSWDYEGIPFSAKIFNAIIPKGSEYYMGQFYTSHGDTAITANQLKYIDICV